MAAALHRDRAKGSGSVFKRVLATGEVLWFWCKPIDRKRVPNGPFAFKHKAEAALEKWLAENRPGTPPEAA